MSHHQNTRSVSQLAWSQRLINATASAGAAGADCVGGPFWSSCAGALYSSRNATLAPQLVPSRAALNGLATRCLHASNSKPAFSSVGFGEPCTQGLRSLPCPTLYQAKEPEAISDVFRRAGKKALGGGIPGDLTPTACDYCCRKLASIEVGLRVTDAACPCDTCIIC